MIEEKIKTAKGTQKKLIVEKKRSKYSTVVSAVKQHACRYCSRALRDERGDKAERGRAYAAESGLRTVKNKDARVIRCITSSSIIIMQLFTPRLCRPGRAFVPAYK